MSEATKNLSLSFLGAGSMNGAILRGIIASGHDPQLITATVRSDNRVAELRELGINVLVSEEDPEANRRAAASADIIFLGVKPVGITELCEEISGSLDAQKVVVSVAAAITLSSMQSHLPAGQPVIRSMPNTPLMVGAGVVGISPAASVSDEQTKLVTDLLSGSGDVHVIDEEQQNALSAISGSGPAYAFYLAEAMANAGVAMGLDEKLSIALARATVAGAGKMLSNPDADPATLRKAVTSPKGTTEQAIATFDEQGIPKIIAAGTNAAAAVAGLLCDVLGLARPALPGVAANQLGAGHRRIPDPRALRACCETLEQVHVPRDDQDISASHHGIRHGVGEILARGLHTNDRHPVLGADLGLGQGEALGLLRRVHLHDGEAVIEFDEVEHAATDQVRGTHTGIGFRVDDVVGTNAGKNLAMGGRNGLDPQMLDAQIHQVHGDQHG